MSGADGPDNDPVWVIQVEGQQFVCANCPRPKGASAPRGRVLQIILDAKTFDERDGGIVDYTKNLSELGEVIILKP